MASGSKMISPRPSKQVEAEQEVADGRFEIGDDSDLEDDEDISQNRLREPPPPYEISGDDSDSRNATAQEPRHGESGVLREEISSPEEPQAEESRTAREHIVRKGDTARSLALKYNLDVSLLSSFCPISSRSLSLTCIYRYLDSHTTSSP